MYLCAILVGDIGVGKTALRQRYFSGKYNESPPTIGVRANSKTVDIGLETLQFEVYDTAGEERFQTIRCPFYRRAHIALLVFDLADMQSFAHLKGWKRKVETQNPSVSCFFIGTKADLPHVISAKQIENVCGKKNVSYFETSAKHNHGIEEMFRSIIFRTYSRIGPALDIPLLPKKVSACCFQ